MKHFWSDLHIGHANIIKYTHRPYADIYEMREMFVKKWNEKVPLEDDGYFGGDICMGRIEDHISAADRFLCANRYLVPGNHDRLWSGNNDSPDKQQYWTDMYEQYFTILDNQINLTLNGQDGTQVEVIMCHFPYQSIARHGNRYKGHAPKDKGKWLLHGHTHKPIRINPELRQFHIGVDAWPDGPVSEHEIVELIKPYL